MKEDVQWVDIGYITPYEKNPRDNAAAVPKVAESIKQFGFLSPIIVDANRMPLRAHENILVFYRKLPTYNPQYSQGKPYVVIRTSTTQIYGYYLPKTGVNETGRRCPLDVVKMKSGVNSSDGSHRTQKPVALLEYLIKTYTNEGELVLDACMGSGSTAVACVNTNRRFIGFETHQPFIDIANRRIAEAREALINTQTSASLHQHLN